ncbi:unnamed protein product [Wickerhamomyces anomalus]
MSNPIPKTYTPLKFVIVGAGLGGLAAAIGLRLSGHHVIMLEQAPELGEVGAGIQIPPNSTKILDALGVREPLLAVSHVPKSYNFRKWDSGDLLSYLVLRPYCLEQYGAPYLHIHRADFHKVLVDRAIEVGVVIKLGARVMRVDFDDNSVITGDRRQFNADVIIGADGLKSQIRQTMLGRPDPPHNTGDIAWRALVRSSEVRKHEDLKFIWEEPKINFWWGPNIHVVVYLLNSNSGETVNIVVLSPDTLPQDVNVEPAQPGEILDLFSDWDPKLKKLLTLVHQTSKWRLQNSIEMKTWVHETGNVALMGDACHATLPYLAQGAAQAVEDSAVLTGLFGRITDKSQIHGLLKTYENLRKWRTTQVVQGSTNCRDIFHLPDGEKQAKRDALLKLSPRKGYPNRWADPVFQKFLFGYDAFKEAERGWNSFVAHEPVTFVDNSLKL